MGRLKQELQERLKRYMKGKDSVGLNCIRMVMSALTTKEKAGPRSDGLSDEEELEAVTSYRKRLQESYDSLKAAGRDLTQIDREIAIVEEFLPRQMTPGEVEAFVRQKVETLRAEDPAVKFGPAMKVVMAELKGRADGKLVNELVRKTLEAL